MRSLILAMVLMVLAAACTSDESSPTTTAPPPSGDIAATTTDGDTESASTTAAVTPQTTTTSEPEPEGPLYIEGIVLPSVTLLTATSGGGERPLLDWEPVDGAAWYQAIVVTSGGDTYWTWPTEDTAVFVSGVESDVTTSPGPRIAQGMTWAVLAFDDTNLLIAQSNHRPIEP
jgi:hypothetical protein